MLSRRKKIEYLHNYNAIKIRIKILLDRKQRIENQSAEIIRSPILSDMPKAKSNLDVNGTQNIIGRLDDVAKIDKEVKLLNLEAQFIECKITAVKQLQLRNIIELRYVDGLSFKEISNVLIESGKPISEQHLFSLHNRALDILDIDDVDVHRLHKVVE